MASLKPPKPFDFYYVGVKQPAWVEVFEDCSFATGLNKNVGTQVRTLLYTSLHFFKAREISRSVDIKGDDVKNCSLVK